MTEKSRSNLQRALSQIDESRERGLRWVAADTGISESRLRSFIGGDLITPDSQVLTDSEVDLLWYWYYFGGDN